MVVTGDRAALLRTDRSDGGLMAEDRITELARRFGVDEDAVLAGAEVVARGLAVTPADKAKQERDRKAALSLRQQQRKEERAKRYPSSADLAPVEEA